MAAGALGRDGASIARGWLSEKRLAEIRPAGA